MTVISTKRNGSSGTGEDHHAGYQVIPSSSIITVAENKNMIVYQELNIVGEIDIIGEVIILI